MGAQEILDETDRYVDNLRQHRVNARRLLQGLPPRLQKCAGLPARLHAHLRCLVSHAAVAVALMALAAQPAECTRPAGTQPLLRATLLPSESLLEGHPAADVLGQPFAEVCLAGRIIRSRHVMPRVGNLASLQPHRQVSDNLKYYHSLDPWVRLARPPARGVQPHLQQLVPLPAVDVQHQRCAPCRSHATQEAHRCAGQAA